MDLDPTINFGEVTVSTGYNSTVTSIDLASGHGARLPSIFSYNLTWWNFTDYANSSDAFHAGEAEIIRVSGRSTDTLSPIARAQEGTSAIAHNTAGKTYKMILSVTKKMMDDIDTTLIKADGTVALTGPWDMGGNTITNVGSMSFGTSTTPQASVHVDGAILATGIGLPAPTTAQGMRLTYDPTGGRGDIAVFDWDTSTWKEAQIRASNILFMTKSGGNVGIDIEASLLAKLHVVQSEVAGAKPVLLLDQTDVSEEMVNFACTVGVGNAIEAVGAKSLTTTHFIKATITGVGTVYMPVGTIA